MALSRKVLLCIDDEPTGLLVRKLLLETVGYSVLTAGSGPEAFPIIQEKPVDAVILDYLMPEMNGGVVAMRLRQIKPTVPILMLSAYVALPEDALAAVDAFVTKGQPPDVLLGSLEALLQEGEHRHPEVRGEYVAFVNCARRYIEVTDGFCALLGYSRAELLGRRVDDITLPDAANVPELFSQYLLSGEQRGTYLLRHRSGRAIRIRYTARVFPDGCMAASFELLRDADSQAA